MPKEGSALQQNIGELFVIFRKSRGLTQRQAAELCGTTQAQITYLEPSFFPRQFGVDGGEELVVREADVALGATDRR